MSMNVRFHSTGRKLQIKFIEHRNLERPFWVLQLMIGHNEGHNDVELYVDEAQARQIAETILAGLGVKDEQAEAE